MPVEDFQTIPFNQEVAEKPNDKHDQFVNFICGPFDDLCGSVACTLDYRPAEEYRLSRFRDLHVLNQLSRFLPLMDNDEATAHLLHKALNHRVVNTLEGG